MASGDSSLRKWKCTLMYDGSPFVGFQRQPEGRTVQGELEAVLRRMHGKPISVVGSGRTDAGVHAWGQVIHFESRLQLDGPTWQKALNAQLPAEIRVTQVEEAPASFHARFDARRKEYRYFIYQAPCHSPFYKRYSWHIPSPLDTDLMQRAAEVLIGTHDFTAFSSAKAEVKDRVRTIEVLQVHVVSGTSANPLQSTSIPFWTGLAFTEQGLADRLITVSCIGTGFLQHMMRIIVGTLVEVGREKRSPGQVEQALKEKRRELAGPTAPPEGLFLWAVQY